jgi:hypothetical protein
MFRGFPRIRLPTHRVFSLVSASCAAVGSTSLQKEVVGWASREFGGVFVESGWFTAYSTGEEESHGANVGGIGWDGGCTIGVTFLLYLEAP